MCKSVLKFFIVICINLAVSAPTYAKVVEQNVLNFPIKADELLAGNIHYYFSILSPRKLSVQHSELYELDSLSLAQESNVMIVVNKSVYVVKKPIGFFDDKQLSEEKYVSYISGDQKVRKTGPASFLVTIPGKETLSYKMNLFFDADDVSTLPNSKVIRAVDAMKKLDVISKSASTIMFSEKFGFSKNIEGGISSSSFIPLKENLTMVITYNLYAVQKSFINEKAFEQSFLDEIQAVKNLMDKYK